MKKNIRLFVLLLCLSRTGWVSAQQCSDPQATKETSALFKNLYRLAGSEIAFGHQDDPCYGVEWKYQEGRSDIRDLTGEYPAVYGFDLGRIELAWKVNLDSVPFDNIRKYIQDAYERGGIVTLSWHLNNPLTGGTAWDNKPGAIQSILPGGIKNSLYTGWLDRVADFLNSCKGKKGEYIPIILRLYHELNGSWFWWGKKQCSAEDMIRCWQYTIHYLRDTKNIHHLLYAYNTDKFQSAGEYLERYPGDAFIDILGFDIYQANQLQNSKDFRIFFDRDLSLIDSLAAAHHKIPALTEFGYNMIPDSSWWTSTFYPVIRAHRVSYALAWRNAGKKQDGSTEFYVPFRGSSSAADFIQMAGTGKILFEKGIKTKNIYHEN